MRTTLASRKRGRNLLRLKRGLLAIGKQGQRTVRLWLSIAWTEMAGVGSYSLISACARNSLGSSLLA